MLSSIATAILLLALPLTAVAHDYSLERDGDDYALYQGHFHSTHLGEKQVPYDPGIIEAAYCTAESGIRSMPRATAYPARFPGPCAVLYVDMSSGYWSQTLTGTVNKPKTEVTGSLRGWLSEESIKRINVWTPAAAAPLTAGFELVPLENPLTLKPGSKLRLQALWQRKPKSGVTVAYDGAARGVTDTDGKVNLRVRHGGAQTVSATFEEPLNDAKADKIVRASILQFQLSEK